MKKNPQPRSSFTLEAAVLRATPGILITDRTGKIIHWSTSAQDLYGYSPAEAIGKSLSWILGGEVAAKVTRLLDRTSSRSGVLERQTSLLTKDGQSVPATLSVSLLRNGSNSVSGSCVIARPVAQKLADAEYRHSEEEYRVLFENNPLPMWLYDPLSLRFITANQSALQLYGYTQEEFGRMTLRDIRPAEDITAMERMATRPLQTRVTEHVGVWRHCKKDGNIILCDVTCHSLNIAGRPAVLSLLLDVTEKHRHEELLRESEQRFSKAFRSSPLGIAMVTVDEGRYVDVNDAYTRMIGAAHDELVGKTVWETNVWTDPLDRQTMISNLKTSGRFTMQTRFNTKDKGICYVQMASELIELGGEACVLSISNDISEAKKLEQQFRQAQKMEAVGRLAAGVAHDFNNMLGIMLGYSELLLDRLQDSSSQHHLKEMKAAAERAATLTRQLLAFSRQQVLQPKVLDLNTVIKDLSSMLRRVIGDDIEFSFNRDCNLGRVEADRGQIEQILMNLAVNARDAMPRGGKLIVATSNADLDEVYASTHPGARSGPYVCISVSDTGMGIPADILPHIYEPFFTTKAQGQGTGLGLSMVYGVVKQSGGYIWAYSEVGKGTRFKVFLPRVETPVDQEPPKPMVSSAKASGTILLVEDDAALRTLTRGVLETNGYKVLEAKDGESALELCTAPESHIDLLLTDVVMSKMSGHELAVCLRNIHPELRVMYVSGYTNDLIASHGVLHDNVALLEKPYTRSSLLQKVKDVLHGPANS